MLLAFSSALLMIWIVAIVRKEVRDFPMMQLLVMLGSLLCGIGYILAFFGGKPGNAIDGVVLIAFGMFFNIMAVVRARQRRRLQP
ncbi:hypothetical protein KW807_01185 [Candidatus Parcubacteria bacterium]|nr:hypothetical protein [Candidatus Parcubacteria bacterium]